MTSQDRSSERYRREAASIRSSAGLVTDDETRAYLLFTARLYEQLAECMPRHVPGRSHGREAAPRVADAARDPLRRG